MNSRFFYKMFEHEIQKSRRTGVPVTLIYLDLDNFKHINDTLGHQTGDFLLKKVSAIISENIRQTDLFARMGGDEFTILFTETDMDLAKDLMKRLVENVVIEMKKHNFPVTLSIGAITIKKFDIEISSMVRMADELMYKVKKNGKNNIEHVVYG